MINTYTSGNKPDLTLRKLFQAQAAQQQAAAATAAANNPFSGMTPQNLLSATPKNILQVSVVNSLSSTSRYCYWHSSDRFCHFAALVPP